MIKKFFKDSLLYTLATLFTKGIGFIMLPIYLSNLNKIEYGIYDYIFTIGSFVSVIISLEITQSVLRFSSEAKTLEEKSLYITSGVCFNFISYVFVCIVGMFFVDNLSMVFTGETGHNKIVILALISYFVTSMLYMSSIIFRSNLDSKSATISAASSAALVAILVIIGLNFFEYSLLVILSSTIIGQLIVVVFNYIRLIHYWCNKPNLIILKKMLLFSSPLIFSSVGVILSTLVDRIVIKEILGFSSLAEYGVAARFASIVTLLTLGFQSALSPLIYSQLDAPSVKSDIRKLFFYYIVISIILMIILFVFSNEILLFITGESYQKSSYVFGILSCAILVQSAYVFFPGLSINGKTVILAVINVGLGVTNLLGNYLLIPIFGINGAAYSTLICAILFFTINMLISERYFSVLNIYKFVLGTKYYI